MPTDARRIAPDAVERHEIQHAIGIDVSQRDRQPVRSRWPSGRAKPLELPGLEVGAHVQLRPAVAKERGIGIAVAVEIAPRESRERP